MIPVDQRFYQTAASPYGDCMRACVASIFELDNGLLPHFVDIITSRAKYKNDPNAMWRVITEWVSGYGMGVNSLYYGHERLFKPRYWHPGYWIGSVDSMVSDTGAHAVVMQFQQVVHDPNPESREAAKGKPYRFRGEWWFELADPSVLTATATACYRQQRDHQIISQASRHSSTDRYE